MSEHDFERIQPASLDMAAPAQPSGSVTGVPVAREARPVNPAVLAIAALLLVAVLVIVVLPRFVGESPAPAPAAVDAPPVAQGAPSRSQPASAPWEEAQNERARSAAKSALDTLLALQYELQQRGVEQWAAAEFAGVTELARQGDQAYRENRHAEAEQAWREGERQLRALSEGIGERLAARLAEGDAAFEAGDAAVAAGAFTEALAIEPGNARATRGLERSGRLDRLKALLAEGAAKDNGGDAAAALESYRAALALDADWQPARSALAALETRLAGERAGASVSAGYAALSAGRIDEARREFQAAIRLGAGAPARDGLQQAEFQASQRRISASLETATRAARDERWKEALDAAESALAIDQTLAPARDLRERAKTRMALDAALEKIAREPRSLMTDAGRSAAEKLIGAARGIADPGPRLLGQISTAETRLAEMRTKIDVQLVSDGKTDVTVFRVGGLGSFSEHRIALLPGDYVAVGRRDGFRDVRVTFEIRPGVAPAPVSVKCGQPI